MKQVDKLLNEIELHIKLGTYAPLETNSIELKDLSSSDNWKQLYITTNAFLNTQGGIIVIGINEDVNKKQYKFIGFNVNYENKLKTINQKFTDFSGNQLKLEHFIKLDYAEIIPFLNGHVCVLYIEKLPENEKFAFYENKAYERNLTGDHIINIDKIKRQNDLIEELKGAVELENVENTALTDLDIDLLNEYIIKLNADQKVETVKADVNAAMSFLIRKKFIRNNKPTLLGLLVCGQHIGDLIGGKCELDAYFETGKTLADDKKIYKDNVISLMEKGWAFTFSKINVGLSVQNGGSVIFEYPEAVIRETINNALAHRDYSSNRFSILRIVNNEFIEIRNPGRFKSNQLIILQSPIEIRRIIPVPRAQNPNLADVLKIYNRWEGRGIGMATLVNYALNNLIDVPYYRIYNKDELGLFIQKGRVLDDETATLFASFDKFIFDKNDKKDLTEDELTVLAYFFKSEKLNLLERFTINLSPDNNHFEAIQKLLKADLITKLGSSTNEYQLYEVNKTFSHTNFQMYLEAIFGDLFNTLPSDYKEVLQTIYQYDNFSKVTEINANLVGNYIYFKKNGANIIDIRKFDTFKRTTRSRINKLEKQGFLLRKVEGKLSYQINTSIQNLPLFNSKNKF